MLHFLKLTPAMARRIYERQVWLYPSLKPYQLYGYLFKICKQFIPQPGTIVMIDGPPMYRGEYGVVSVDDRALEEKK